ncbi:hypothetical protein BD779DRAFT_1676593 [Infundibulicybe gibba]|nr:hypothetical protein BD779DRAFT_1676593 [Infundibulicybe gibba]
MSAYVGPEPHQVLRTPGIFNSIPDLRRKLSLIPRDERGSPAVSPPHFHCACMTHVGQLRPTPKRWKHFKLPRESVVWPFMRQYTAELEALARLWPTDAPFPQLHMDEVLPSSEGSTISLCSGVRAFCVEVLADAQPIIDLGTLLILEHIPELACLELRTWGQRRDTYDA